MNIALQRTTSPTLHIVHIGRRSLAFSYETVIGFIPEGGLSWVTSENIWSNTTGKHLNYLDNGRKADRLPYGAFTQAFEDEFGGVAVNEVTL